MLRARGRLPGRSHPASWLLGGVLLLAVVFVPGLAVAQFLSPGPLAEPHKQLEGDANCESCHSAGRGVPNAKCNGCHEPIAKSQARGTGLHGRKFAGQPCAKCHSDHHGRGFAMIRWDPKRFAHEDTGWPLGGDHATTPCAGCHKTKSYIGLSTGCASCHKDPHANRFGSQCLTCHDESDWNHLNLRTFDHGLARFPLKGRHADVKCEGCHQGSPPAYVGLTFSACTSCHKDPHQGQLGASCENCHSERGWRAIVLKAGAHPWLSLANGHAKTACGKCHDRGTLRAPSRGRACVGCHSPVHEANFGTRCENCHASIDWLGLPRKVGLSSHDKTPYPLKGKHEDTPCSGCHRPELEQVKRYRGLEFARCDACHADDHAGRFARRDKGECAPCHDEQGFRPSLFGLELHAGTRLPLVGHHAAVPCATCHVSAGVEGKRLDWSSKKTACADCHENPHGTQFQKEMQKNGCATCHTPRDWDVPNIDHSIWPLTGAHASTACGGCHTPTERDRKAGMGPSYRLAPRICEGCHEDEHRGQFRLTAPQRTCGYCHTTVAFTIRNFPHAARTGYELEGKHGTLSCDRCHAKRVLSDGATSVSYRLGYRGCRDCHADPHRQATR